MWSCGGCPFCLLFYLAGQMRAVHCKILKFSVWANENILVSLRSQVISCNKNICTLQITDTTGSHQFPAMQRLSITKGHAFILVYSVCSRQSLEELRPIWSLIKELKVCVCVCVSPSVGSYLKKVKVRPHLFGCVNLASYCRDRKLLKYQ